MKTEFLLVLCCCTVLLFGGCTTGTNQKDGTLEDFILNQNESGVRVIKGYSQKARLFYLLTLPPKGENETEKTFPLLVFLHSLEERGGDIQGLIQNPAGQGTGLAGYAIEHPEFAFATLSPLCPRGRYWSFLHRRLALLIQEISEFPMINSRQILLSGVSMGAIGTWSFVMAYPEMVNGIIPIAGGVYTPPIFPRYGKIAHLRVLAFHDVNDPSIPYKVAKATMDKFTQAGGVGTLVEYNSGEHYIQNSVFHSPTFHEWIK